MEEWAMAPRLTVWGCCVSCEGEGPGEVVSVWCLAVSLALQR